MPNARSLISLCLLVSGCSTLPSEPRSSFLVERSWGVAGGRTQEEALYLAGIIEEVLPVYTELEGFTQRPLRAHLTGDLGVDHFAGMSIEAPGSRAWIMVRRGAEDVELTVAHEMAHYYFDELQSKFPTIVEEGLCELQSGMVFDAQEQFETRLVMAAVSHLERVTIEVQGAKSKAMLAWLLESVPSIEEALEIGRSANLETSLRTAATSYGLGWLLVELIGWEGMLLLARRSDQEGLERVPVEWILAAAGLQPLTQENLEQAFRRALGEGDQTSEQPITITLRD